MGVDKWIVRRIANDAHGILTLLNFFHFTEHHFAQQNDAAIGAGQPLVCAVAIGPCVSHAI